MTRASEVPVPGWAERARTICRAAMGAWGVLLLTRLGLGLMLSQPGKEMDVLRWSEILLVGVLTVGLVAGAVWVAGAAVRGYREDGG